jgi:hypothetical protein
MAEFETSLVYRISGQPVRATYAEKFCLRKRERERERERERRKEREREREREREKDIKCQVDELADISQKHII